MEEQERKNTVGNAIITVRVEGQWDNGERVFILITVTDAGVARVETPFSAATRILSVLTRFW